MKDWQKVLLGIKRGNEFCKKVSIEWVKENDSNLYDFIVDELYSWESDEGNTTDINYVNEFLKNGIVEYTFQKDGVSYTLGLTSQEISNNNSMCSDNYRDIFENGNIEILNI